MGGFRKSGGSGANSSPCSYQSQEPAKAGSSRPSDKGLTLAQPPLCFIGVWGTWKKMSFSRIVWQCLYLQENCWFSMRHSHKISSVTGCLIAATLRCSPLLPEYLPVGSLEHGLNFLPLDESCLHSSQQTSIDLAGVIGTDHREIYISLVQQHNNPKPGFRITEFLTTLPRTWGWIVLSRGWYRLCIHYWNA